MDDDTLPLVREAIRQLQGKSGERPKRITAHAVEKLLGLPEKRIKLLPKCRTQIDTCQETQEEYWGRELIWAVHQLKREGKKVNYKQNRFLKRWNKNHSQKRKKRRKRALRKPVCNDRLASLVCKGQYSEGNRMVVTGKYSLASEEGPKHSS